MKVYSIGREAGCDIVINDSTDVISRRHAILNVLPSGKMTIIDQSHNGTYVNGIRITPNVPVPVTRKDSISLAHVAQLNWDMVPKSQSPLRYVLIGIIGLVVIGGCIFGYNQLTQSNNAAPANPTAADSVGIKQDSVKNKTDVSSSPVIVPKETKKTSSNPPKTSQEKGKQTKSNDHKQKTSPKKEPAKESSKEPETKTFR